MMFLYTDLENMRIKMATNAADNERAQQMKKRALTN